MSENTIHVLNDGFVRLLDTMGTEADIVEAARVSYENAGLTFRRTDEGLLKYLMRHGHTSPFEQVEVKFHIRAPIFVARQWLRHRTANVNEQSARYSVLRESYYVPPEDRIVGQSSTNKQASSDVRIECAEDIATSIASMQEAAFDQYKWLLEQGLSREVARTVLPVGAYTEFYWKIDGHNLMGFLSKRLHTDAQPETRLFAQAVEDHFKRWLPITHSAFVNYRRDAVNISAVTASAFRALLRDPEVTREFANALWRAGVSDSERREIFREFHVDIS